MEINKLIEIVKEKITKEITLQEINVEDKSFLHKDHKNNSPNKFHIKISIISCLLYTSPSPRDISGSRMPSSA